MINGGQLEQFPFGINLESHVILKPCSIKVFSIFELALKIQKYKENLTVKGKNIQTGILIVH